MATSPAPDAAAPPGMCPGVAVLGGGGGSGDGSGDGSGGKDGSGGGGSGDGDGSGGDGKNAGSAPDPNGYPECGTASHPVDVVTGRAFTHPLLIIALPGPLPLVWERVYSSSMAHLDTGFGHGWAHTLGWRIEVGRRHVTVWNEQGVGVHFDTIPVGGETFGPFGWLLQRDGSGYIVDAGDDHRRIFLAAEASGKRHRLTAIEDRNRNRIALSYDDKGRLTEVKDSAGRVLRIRPAEGGHIGAVEARNAFAQGQWVAFETYAYDEHHNLISATDADGFTARYAYDDEHKLTADTDRTGLTFHFAYDREGRCIESWGDYPGRRDPSLVEALPTHLADGETRAKGIHHCRFDYMPGGYSEVANSTQVRRFFGNAHGTLDKRVEGGAVTTATYRDDGHLMSRTDPVGATTIFERDARGRVLKIADPLGRVTEIARDGNGLPVEVTDPAGGVTRVARDARGNALFFTDPTGAVTARRYDERGLVLEEVSPTGARTTYAHDAHGNLTAITQANGGVWRVTYDALGRLLSRTDPLGAETRYSYSARGDLVAVRDALGAVTRYAYDGEGHLTQVVDPKGRITQLLWGGYHKLCARKDANGNEVRLRYNLEGELVEVYNERGEVHRLVYNTSGKLISETTFDGRELHYRRDAAGRVVRMRNGLGQITELAYDLAGQLIQRELDSGSIEALSYNARGELTDAKGQGCEFRIERDAVGRVVREVQVVADKVASVESAYDAAGERVERKTSLGHVEVVTRGVLGERARTVLDGVHVVDHHADALGREIARALPGGGWLQSGYDAQGRLERRRAGGAALRGSVMPGEPEQIGARAERVTVDTAYRYDWDGELIESWDQRRGRTRYAYDPIGQLLAMVPEKARAEMFRYDTAGNLYEGGLGAVAREYGRGNRLLRQGDSMYFWDDDGRLVAKRTRNPESGNEEVWSYRWNAAGLLEFVERPDGMRVEFSYDPFARRVLKQVTQAGPTKHDLVPVSETRFVWDGDVLVHEIEARTHEGGNPVVEERTYWFEDGGFEPVAHREQRRDDVGRDIGGWCYYVNDPIGTPERLIGDDGDVVCELRRSAWGKAEEAPDGKARTRLRLQGQYEDEETGLRYSRYRYYDADAGRFISADPLGLNGGLNAFAFGRNAVSGVDPLGLAYTVSPARRTHILEGDPPGTGHGPPQAGVPSRAPGRRGVFPATWTDDQAIAAIERVANSPTSTWRQSTGSGCQTAPITTGGPDPNAPATTSKNSPTRFEVHGRDHGQNIVVIVEPGPGGAGIITGYVR